MQILIYLAVSMVLIVSGSAVATSNTTLPTKLVFQFPPITWVENLAVRPNGRTLPITTTSPVLNQLDPQTGKLDLIHDFSAAGNAIQGITQVRPDVFALDVLTCNISLLACTPGSVTTFLVSFHSPQSEMATIERLTNFPKSGLPNGIAALDDDIVLLADSSLGGIWSLSIRTRVSKFLFSDPSMAPSATIGTGVNGIRVRGNTLYFTNSALGTFNRIPIDPRTGMKIGNASVIATELVGPDDFEVDDQRHVAYVCMGAADQIVRVELDGDAVSVLTSVPGPTSVRWGTDGDTLYVSDVGGLSQYITGNVTIGGAVRSLHLS